MKIQKRLRSRQDAFTLIELITVVSIIVIIFSLVVGGFTYADRSSKRSRTEVVVRAVRSGLEAYKEKFGAYPEVADPGSTISIADKPYIAGGAACLYQAMSGDGFDAILNATGDSSPQSDGNLDRVEAENVTLNDMPREMWTSSDGFYYLVDGFGHPLRYVKAAPSVSATPGQPPPDATTVNRGTYDIWSYGEDTENLTATSLDAAEDGPIRTASLKWIKNW